MVSSPTEKRAYLSRLDTDLVARYRSDTSDGKEITVDWRRLPSELVGFMGMLRVLHMSPREMEVDISKVNEALLNVRGKI